MKRVKALSLVFVGLLIGYTLSPFTEQSDRYILANTNESIVNNAHQYNHVGQKMYWEDVEKSSGGNMYLSRAWVPGGWLVHYLFGMGGAGITFYPDPDHRWQPKVKKGAPWAAAEAE